MPLIIVLTGSCAVVCAFAVWQHLRLRKVNALVQRMDGLATDMAQALQHESEEQPFSFSQDNPHLIPCWRTKNCEQTACAAHENPDLRCWQVKGTLCREGDGTGERCETCEIYEAAQPDVVWQLSERLNHMVALLERSRTRAADSRRRAEQASKLAALGEFAAGIAHEINNPLDGALSCLARLERDPTNLTQNIEYLQLMQEALKRVSAVVQHILNYSRKRDMVLEPLDLHAVLEDVADLIRVSARQKALRLRFQLEDGLPVIMADKYYLSEAFLNLAANSIAATPEGGTLTFRTQIAQSKNGSMDYVAVEVADTGTGIAPEHLPEVTEPFFTTKEPGKGTGLGLSVAKQIVEEHHGKLSIDSTLQAGTTVLVLLPFGMEQRNRSSSEDRVVR